jgi:hypothetical protein
MKVKQMIFFYILGTVFGDISEYFLREETHMCNVNPFSLRCLSVYTILNTYGWVSLIIYLIYQILGLKTYIIIIPLLIIVECFIGYSSKWFYGDAGWNYNSGCCDGYVSLPTTLYFTFWSCILVFIIYLIN